MEQLKPDLVVTDFPIIGTKASYRLACRNCHKFLHISAFHARLEKLSFKVFCYFEIKWLIEKKKKLSELERETHFLLSWVNARFSDGFLVSHCGLIQRL